MTSNKKKTLKEEKKTRVRAAFTQLAASGLWLNTVMVRCSDKYTCVAELMYRSTAEIHNRASRPG